VLQRPEVNGLMVQRGTQGFFLSEKARNAAILAPGEKAILGSVYFEGSGIGEYRGKLLIRTNTNVYEAVELYAEAKYARLAFRRELSYGLARPKVRATFIDMASIDIFITEDDILSQIDLATDRLPAHLTVTKHFQAENVGNTELRISKVLLNAYSCELMGLRVENCDKAYAVKPSGTIEIAISYEVTFKQRELQANLCIYTEENSFYIPIKVTIDVENWGKYAKLRLFDRKSTAYCLSELFTLLDYIFSIGCLIVVFKEVLSKPEIVHFRLVSTRICTKRDQFPPKTRLQAPILMRKFVPEPDEPELTLPSRPILPENQPKSAEFKPKKCKKSKVSILKFAPQRNDSPKSAKSKHNELIATNRLLLAKKKPIFSGISEA
jgi:hypothetical protein